MSALSRRLASVAPVVWPLVVDDGVIVDLRDGLAVA